MADLLEGNEAVEKLKQGTAIKAASKSKTAFKLVKPTTAVKAKNT
jgi:hypothetical protein